MKNEEPRAANDAERQQVERRAAIERETTGMSRAFAALQSLDHMGRRRAMRWLAEALDNDPEPPF